MHRIRAGWFVRVNPFNPKQAKRVDLGPEQVDAIVFWSKHPKPLLTHLTEIEDRGYNYYFQYTLNDYPPAFEPKLPDLSVRIECFSELAERLGPERVLWRYDPIICSTLTPVSYHVERFGQLASRLQGVAGRVTISFLDMYGKIKPRLRSLAQDENIVVEDLNTPAQEATLRKLSRQLAQIAGTHGLAIQTCCESLDLSEYGISHGSCIDGRHISRLFGVNVKQTKDRAQRSECLCVPAVDMGHYDTCRFECVYCYGMRSDNKAAANALRHDPTSPVLIGESPELR